MSKPAVPPAALPAPAGLLARARAMQESLVALRRELHAHPELAWREADTAGRMAREMNALGLPLVTGIAGTHGLMATLESGRPGPTLVLRADMDGLGIAERTGAAYASQAPGAMHACGHDAHMTCLVGAARLLVELRGALCGTLRFVFQPAEEAPPGGAKPLIEQGRILEGAAAAVALHVLPQLPVGTLGFRPGPMLAQTAGFLLTIHGTGGHGGRPHQTVDAIAAAAQVYQALQYLVSRENDPLQPLVLSVGKIAGGSAANAIAAEVTLEGTVRALDPALAAGIAGKMERVIAGVCQAARATFRFEFSPGFPALVNDPAFTARAMASAAKLLGPEAVRELPTAEMGGEDFAYFAQALPACFFRLGVGNPARGIVHPLHHPEFDLDESALSLGAATLAQIAVDFLASTV